MRIFIILFLICIAGCAGMSNKNSKITDKKPLWSYGNYCGGGYPNLSFGVKPVDDLDLICYYHDVCYELIGGSDFCDEDMLNNLVIFSKSRISQQCASVYVDLSIFAASNISRDTPTAKILVNGFTRLLQAPYLLALSALIYHGTPDSPGQCFFESKNSTDGFYLVAPISVAEIGVIKSCQDIYNNRENSIKYYKDDNLIAHEQRNSLVGPRKMFRNLYMYHIYKGCGNFPIRSSWVNFNIDSR